MNNTNNYGMGKSLGELEKEDKTMKKGGGGIHNKHHKFAKGPGGNHFKK